jgi:hypothetical protein
MPVPEVKESFAGSVNRVTLGARRYSNLNSDRWRGV